MAEKITPIPQYIQKSVLIYKDGMWTGPEPELAPAPKMSDDYTYLCDNLDNDETFRLHVDGLKWSTLHVCLDNAEKVCFLYHGHEYCLTQAEILGILLESKEKKQQNG